MSEVKFDKILHEIIESDDQGLLRDNDISNKQRILDLIKAQDLVRQVFCSESGETYTSLRKIDIALTSAINRYR